MAKRKKKSKKKNSKTQANWSAMDEIRHPTPPKGFAFKDRKRDLKDKEDRNEMKNY